MYLFLKQDEVFINVAGIFEYDRTLKVQGDYRRFLFETVHMKCVVNLSDDLTGACKFLYRLKYVRDIMLHPTIDDPGITAINSMITFTSCEISSQVNTKFLNFYLSVVLQLSLFRFCH